MVTITLISGKWAGRSRQLTLADVDPLELFRSFLNHKDDWKVDYSSATEEEAHAFFLAELIARMMRALTDGRLVKFLGQEWRLTDGNKLGEVAQKIEDAISSSRRIITIEHDDARGLKVGVHGWEN